MKKFVPYPQKEQVEELKQIEKDQKLTEKEQGFFSKKEDGSISNIDKWETWGFTKKRKEEVAESSNSKKQKKEKCLVEGKSDIIISLDEKWALPIEKREKTYEFRKYKLNNETKRMWFYVNRPISQLLYIAEIEPAVEYPNQISENGIGNQEFNQGLKQSKFAYKIKHLYKLNSPVGSKELKSEYQISPPQKYSYVSKYPNLVKDIVIEEQIKLY